MSGGAPRLENRAGRALPIRGSLVALLESRRADEPWRIDADGAPAHHGGCGDLLHNGTAPPGTPHVIGCRRADSTDLAKTECDDALAGR